jgi:hypothetical protein
MTAVLRTSQNRSRGRLWSHANAIMASPHAILQCLVRACGPRGHTGWYAVRKLGSSYHASQTAWGCEQDNDRGYNRARKPESHGVAGFANR